MASKAPTLPAKSTSSSAVDPELTNFIHLCRIVLDNIAGVLRKVFKKEYQRANLGKEWSDGKSCGKWFHIDEHSPQLMDYQKDLLESGCLGEWDVTLLARVLLYSKHLLLVDDTIPFPEFSIKQDDSSKLMSCSSDTDLTTLLHQGDILICDFGYMVRFNVKDVDQRSVTLTEPVVQKLKKPPKGNFRIYRCSAHWKAVEQLNRIRNMAFAHRESTHISTGELQDVVNKVEKLYGVLKIQQQDINDMKNILEERYDYNQAESLALSYQDKWLDPREGVIRKFVTCITQKPQIGRLLANDPPYFEKSHCDWPVNTLHIGQILPQNLKKTDLQKQAKEFSERIDDDSETINLKKFFDKIETSEYKCDFRVGIEARFGKMYWQFPPGVPRRNLQPEHFNHKKTKTTFKTEVSEADVNHLLRKRRPDAPLEKKNVRVTFQMIIRKNASEYIALINENEGVFSLASVYRQTMQKHKATFNFCLPGRKYDFRISDDSGSQVNYYGLSPYQAADTIARKMRRGIGNSLSIIMYGALPDKEEWKWRITCIRQRVQTQYNWNNDKEWVLVKYDVDQFVPKGSVNEAEINQRKTIFNQQEISIQDGFTISRKELELWAQKVFADGVDSTQPSRQDHMFMKSSGELAMPGQMPQKPCDWKTEDLLGDFEDFLFEAFKIAHELDPKSAAIIMSPHTSS